MNMSTGDNAKRKKRPKETGTLIGVRLQPALLAALDAHIGDSGKSRPEVIRELIEAQLSSNP